MSDTGDTGMSLLGNDILDTIGDATGCIWSDEWQDGVSMTMKSVTWMKSITTVTVEHLDSIEVAAGRFEDCIKVNLDIKDDSVNSGLKYRTGKKEYYYAKGIGIIKCVHYFKDGAVVANYELTSYEGTGEGYIPVKDGLFRRYEAMGLTDGFIGKAEYTFCEDDGIIKVIQNRTGIRERKPYSPYDWEDMILQMQRKYWLRTNNIWQLNDVSFYMERAAALADTKYRKAHTAVAIDVMKRIFEGDTNYTPNGKFIGHWNFLQYHEVHFGDGKIKLNFKQMYQFEWKNTIDTGDMGYHLAVNHFMDIINDATCCIWSDEWQAGTSMTMKSDSWLEATTEVTVEHMDNVEVAAGRFEDCLKITFDIKSSEEAGWLGFSKGKKEYYYAKGIGLIKGVHYFKDDTVVPNYELTSYDGTGEGYMPVQDGLFRRYEAMGLTDGFIGKAEYTFCENDNGKLVILENNTGIKMKSISEQA